MNDQLPYSPDLVGITADIVSAYVANNAVRSADLTALIGSVHGALAGIVSPIAAKEPERPEPRVPIRKSVTSDFIFSLEDGKPYKSLKRHLAKLGLTPEAYRAKWELPFDYPMVAPNYAKARSDLARSMGFGRRESEAASAKGKSGARSASAAKAAAAGPSKRQKQPARRKRA
jgi:predicted transcriptional regulator